MDDKVRILLAEDDTNLGFVIRDNLEQHGFQVDLYQNGEEALQHFEEGNYQLCILDVMMPKMDGFALATAIRERNKSIPLLFLTAKTMKEDKLRGFQIGGDDYITKPFSIEELLMRIRVFLRRSGIEQMAQDSVYILGNLIFEPKNLIIRSVREEKTLTRMEVNILKYLCDRKNDVVTRKSMLEAVWGNDDYFSGRSLDVFITRLRKHLSSDERIKITNHHGVGFRLAVEEEK